MDYLSELNLSINKLSNRLKKANELFKRDLYVPNEREITACLMIKIKLDICKNLLFLANTAPRSFDREKQKQHFNIVLNYLKTISMNNFCSKDFFETTILDMSNFFNENFLEVIYYYGNMPYDHVDSYYDFLLKKFVLVIKSFI